MVIFIGRQADAAGIDDQAPVVEPHGAWQMGVAAQDHRDIGIRGRDNPLASASHFL
jgi:hypothetical protein